MSRYGTVKKQYEQLSCKYARLYEEHLELGISIPARREEAGEREEQQSQEVMHCTRAAVRLEKHDMKIT